MDDHGSSLLALVDQLPSAWCSFASARAGLPTFTFSAQYLQPIDAVTSTCFVDSVAADPGEAWQCVSSALLRENLELRQQVGYWKSMQERATARLAEREAEVAQLQAKLKLRERQLFGRKSEQGTTGPEAKSRPAARTSHSPASLVRVPRL